MQEKYGQLKVTKDENSKQRPLPKIYVKVFTRNNSNQVSFWKDGYTDLRGKFDYAIKSGGGVDNIDKYAILIVSTEYGSQIKEVGPPSKLGKIRK